MESEYFQRSDVLQEELKYVFQRPFRACSDGSLFLSLFPQPQEDDSGRPRHKVIDSPGLDFLGRMTNLWTRIAPNEVQMEGGGC